jgi:hypothetical protein
VTHPRPKRDAFLWISSQAGAGYDAQSGRKKIQKTIDFYIF